MKNVDSKLTVNNTNLYTDNGQHVLLYRNPEAALRLCDKLNNNAEIFKYVVAGFFHTGTYGIERFDKLGCFCGYVTEDQV